MYKNIFLKLNSIIVLILVGCAGSQEKLLPIDLTAIQKTTVIEQQLQIKTSSRSILMDGVIIFSPKKIDLFGSFLGIQVFHFIYDGQNLLSEGINKLPAGIDSHAIFNDAMYVFAPSDNLRNALPQQASYTEDSTSRKIILPSGKEINIAYKKESDLAGQAVLNKSQSSNVVLFKYVIDHDNELSKCAGSSLCAGQE